MYCSNCGKKISKSSKFCQYCGNEIVNSEKKVPSTEDKSDLTPVKYEKKKFVWKFPKGAEPIPISNSITLSEIRNRFWEEYKVDIESELANSIEEGWKPIKDVNSSRIELKKIEHTSRPQIDLLFILIAIVTFGLNLLVYFLMSPTTYHLSKPIEFSLPMRRVIN